MEVLLELVTPPERGVLEIEARSIEIRVSAEEARRKVRGWVRDSVSNMMRAEQPVLVVNGAGYWRVPVVLTASHVGTVGQVGSVDVDVITGDMDISNERKLEMGERAAEYVKHYPPYTPMTSVPEKYLPKTVSFVLATEPPDDDYSDRSNDHR